LYDFFADSSASLSQWRVILNGMAEAERTGVAMPDFNESRHAAICTELKFLYVGLTRARNHCWLWDTSDKAGPMRVGLKPVCRAFKAHDPPRYFGRTVSRYKYARQTILCLSLQVSFYV
jgi:hypothetical protein